MVTSARVPEAGELLRQELLVVWAAGFFDGEGSWFYDTQGYLALTVGQKTREACDRFRDAVGRGKVYGPYKNNGNGFYQFKAGGKDAVYVLDLLKPYLLQASLDKTLFVGYRNEEKHEAYLTRYRRKIT